MANVIHAVVRLDDMSGTTVDAALKSVKFYDGDAPAAIDNAQFVVLGDKIDREVYKATAPTADSTRSEIYLVAGVELFYDETTTHYLTEWENEADKAVRVYELAPNVNHFSATAEAFDGEPEVGKFVGFAAGSTKIVVQTAKDAKTVGKITFKETTGWGDGAYTYYMIDTVAAK